MIISEIFSSIDGEARRAGELATFVRSVGCNLRCKYCFSSNQNNIFPTLCRPDGSLLPINEARIGDEVLTYVNGKIEITTITDAFNRVSTEYERISFKNTSFIVTPEHPFMSVKNKWIDAKDLKLGDEVVKVPEYEIALYQVLNEESVNALKEESKYLLNNYSNLLKGTNNCEKNGNYKEDIKERNYSRLKYLINNNIITQDILTGETEKLCVHHIDGNHDNDSVENLIIISSKLHNKIHARGFSFGKSNLENSKKEIVIRHSRSYGEDYCHQLGRKEKTFYGITCEPYNSYLINNILVHNCDSQYTWCKDESAREVDVEQIVEECKLHGNTNITFTGGEPLIQKDADELIEALTNAGFEVSIETDGAVDFTTRGWFNNRDKMNAPWVCVDYKCPSSGMTDKMIALDKFAKLGTDDVVKFVVGSKEDLEEALRVMDELRTRQCYCWFYISPVFGKIEPVEIVEFMKENHLEYKTRFQVQLHKIVWDPNKRGV